jgi:hypothetical protein
MWLVWSIYKLITKTKLWNISKSVENLQFRKWQHTRVIYWIKVKKSIWRGDIENISMNIPLPQQIKLPMSVNDLDQSEYVPTAVCYDHSGHLSDSWNGRWDLNLHITTAAWHHRMFRVSTCHTWRVTVLVSIPVILPSKCVHWEYFCGF